MYKKTLLWFIFVYVLLCSAASFEDFLKKSIILVTNLCYNQFFPYLCIR